jgi:hypothetical protein
VFRASKFHIVRPPLSAFAQRTIWAEQPEEGALRENFRAKPVIGERFIRRKR